MRDHGIGLTQAFRTLTILPAPGKDARNASTQLFFYPFVGLIIGLFGGLIMWICCRFININSVTSLVLGTLWTCWMAFATRGFHLDGLGDTADGFGGGWTKEKRLQIMKDSRSGSFGVIAICLCLVLKSASASYVLLSSRLPVLVWSAVVSRLCVVLMCSSCSYAKESGLSYDLVSGAGFSHVLCAIVQSAAFGLALYYCSGLLEDFCITLTGLLVPACAAALSTLVLALVSKRKIGGITGDVLGACCEISETMALLSVVFLK
ncbi:MAG: adenosylcobinamide-GDP ribazoletransferase [Sphaerochaetaceae bacterium]|nr:adenosylcobinamide-GDP ribazoletransferase [Sphaerochaetaceae bacterium]